MKAGGHVAEYSFRDLNVHDIEDVDGIKITEGFSFGSFDSVNNGYYLIERSAPTPDEKEITETIPYSQGVLDFSVINNERFFSNREVTYKIEAFDHQYSDRKLLENSLKYQLMPLGITAIHDTHDHGLHWFGKCKSIEAEDDEEYQTLIATIVFDCYPFAIGDLLEGTDIWDDVLFTNWVFQDTKFTVDGTQSINLINIGSHIAETKIIVTGTVSITGDFGSMTLTAGTYTDTQLTLNVGENKLTLSGSGTINFEFYKEVMI